MAAGQLLATITALSNRPRREQHHALTFGVIRNASVVVTGAGAAQSGQRVAIFAIRRRRHSRSPLNPGQNVLVPFTVTDACGDWRTFVAPAERALRIADATEKTKRQNELALGACGQDLRHQVHQVTARSPSPSWFWRYRFLPWHPAILRRGRAGTDEGPPVTACVGHRERHEHVLPRVERVTWSVCVCGLPKIATRWPTARHPRRSRRLRRSG